MRDREAEHIKSQCRTDIRYSLATEQGLARMYGVKVATIRAIKASAVRNHPARLAALARRVTAEPLGGGSGGHQALSGTGTVKATLVPATQLQPVAGQGLHTEGGVDLPHTLQ